MALAISSALRPSAPSISRRAAFPKRAIKVDVLGGVADERHLGGIPRQLVPLGIGGDSLRLGAFQIPLGHALALTEDQRAAVAVELDTFGKAGIGRGAGHERANRPTLKLDRGDGEVLALDGVNGGRGTRTEALHRAGQPLQQVDAVDRLVDQHRAALAGQRAAPGASRVVGRLAPPLGVAIGQENPAELAFVEVALDLARQRHEAHLELGAEPNAARSTRRDDPVRLGKVAGHRLFDQHVHAGLRG